MKAQKFSGGSPPVHSKADILFILEKYRVPLNIWGIGKNRSLDDLVRYMTEDKVYFCNGNSPHLILDVHVAVVIVTHCFRGKWLELYEDRQVFSDGSILRRKSFNGIANR